MLVYQRVVVFLKSRGSRSILPRSVFVECSTSDFGDRGRRCTNAWPHMWPGWGHSYRWDLSFLVNLHHALVFYFWRYSTLTNTQLFSLCELFEDNKALLGQSMWEPRANFVYSFRLLKCNHGAWQLTLEYCYINTWVCMKIGYSPTLGKVMVTTVKVPCVDREIRNKSGTGMSHDWVADSGLAKSPPLFWDDPSFLNGYPLVNSL